MLEGNNCFHLKSTGFIFGRDKSGETACTLNKCSSTGIRDNYEQGGEEDVALGGGLGSQGGSWKLEAGAPGPHALC